MPPLDLRASEPAPRRSRSGRPSRASKPQPVRSPDAHLVPRLDGLVILLVEDEPDSRETTRLLLEHHGATVITARNGHEALRRLRMIHPDVIVSDILMPMMDGYEFVRALRANPRWADLPVIALTALGADRDYLQTWSEGFAAHLAKPVDDADLAAVILRVVRSSRR